MLFCSIEGKAHECEYLSEAFPLVKDMHHLVDYCLRHLAPVDTD